MPTLPPAELYDRIALRHGHRCPMSTLGGRLGHAARRRLGEGARLSARYLLRTCALDGIAAATGCTETEGSLAVRDEGRHALTLRDFDSAAEVTVELTARALELAWEYRRRDEALAADWERLSAAERRSRADEKDAFLDLLLQRLRTLPEEELIAVTHNSSLSENLSHA